MEMMGHNSDAIAGNWIALSRDMATHWLVGFGQPVSGANKNRGAYSRSEAWIDLIMLARWKPGTETNKGRKIDLGVGQLQGGYSFLALRWNWTLKQVRAFLEKLVTEQMIEKGQPPRSRTVTEGTSKQGKQQGNQVQIVTLCNYSKYQLSWDLEGLLKGQAVGKRGASEGQHLNKETLKQDTDLERERGDRVEVNCEAMHLHFGGKSKTIPFSTIDLWATNARLYDFPMARNIVRGVMEGWIADGKLPEKPSLELQRRLKYGNIDDEVGLARIANERKRGSVQATNRKPRPWD